MRAVLRRKTHPRYIPVPPWLQEGRTAIVGPPRTLLSNQRNEILIRRNGQVVEAGVYDFLWRIYQKTGRGLRSMSDPDQEFLLLDLLWEWYPLRKRALWIEVVNQLTSEVLRISIADATRYGAEVHGRWAIPFTRFQGREA